METLIAVLLFFILAGVGWQVWARNTPGVQDNAAARERHNADQETITSLKADLADREQRITVLAEELVTLKTDQAARQEREKSGAERIKALENMQEKMQQTFKNLAQDALEGNRDKFMTDANEKFLQHMAPVKEVLEKYQKSLADMEKARKSSEGALKNELANLVKGQDGVVRETAKLTLALRSSPTTRGRWGEQTLRNVMELAGMSEHCDFDTQKIVRRDDVALRPDVLIYLPADHCLIVDAKTSLDAYLDSVDEADESRRDAHLKNHARALRTHMTLLASKNYWDNLTLKRTPDFVVMFIPGENFYSAAMKNDPDLFEDAIARKVLITSPTTFIALARAIAYGWRQDVAARNADEIRFLGNELYKRLAKLGERLIALGGAITGTERRYNELLGTIETSVLPQARRFRDLVAPSQGRDSAEPEPERLEYAVRSPTPGRDLHVPDSTDSDVKESETTVEES